MKKNHLVGDALILTVSDQIEELDYLLESLPNTCSFNCMERIEIGAGTMMGEGVRFYDHDHIYTAEKIEKWQWTTAPIRVGRDCWIGSNVTILKGVTIGDNTIIGAGCLIRNDIPSNSVVYNNGNLFVKRRD